MRALVLFYLLAQAATQDQTPGSISGRMIDAETGQPIAGAVLFLSGRNGTPQGSTRTDEHGDYKFSGLPPGPHALIRSLYFGNDYRNLQLEPGGSLTVNYRILQEGEISGRVYDENKDPIVGMPVHIVLSEYEGGMLRHFANNMIAITNDRGEYAVHRVPSGRSVAVLFEPFKLFPRIVSPVPADPKLRKPAYRPTYFPRGDTAQAGTPVRLRSGEKRENVDIQIQRSPSYCIDGTVMVNGRPASLSLMVADSLTWAPNSGPGGMTKPDGKFRVCDLYPGTFTITAQGIGPDQFLVYGAADATIEREDVHNVTVSAAKMPQVTGNLSWDGPPPPNADAVRLSLGMTSGMKTGQLWWSGLEKPVPPGPFSFFVTPLTDFAVYPKVTVGYIKDVTYGGISILHRAFRLNGNQSLEVLAGSDGGAIKVSAPADAKIVILPETVPNEAYLSDAMVTGEIGIGGVFVSPTLAPGKYHVLATLEEIDKTPECIAALWRARPRATDVDVSPQATVSIAIAEPVSLK